MSIATREFIRAMKYFESVGRKEDAWLMNIYQRASKRGVRINEAIFRGLPGGFIYRGSSVRRASSLLDEYYESLPEKDRVVREEVDREEVDRFFADLLSGAGKGRRSTIMSGPQLGKKEPRVRFATLLSGA